MQDQISAAVLFLAKLIERSNTSDPSCNAEQLEVFKTKLSELLNDRFANHWFPEAPNRGQGYRCIRLNKNMNRDRILENAAKASGMSYEDMRLPVELTLWVDPHEVCCRFGESKGSYCTLASFNDKENQEIFISDELFNRAASGYQGGYSNSGGRRQHGLGQQRNRRISEQSSGSSADEKMNSPLKQKTLLSNQNFYNNQYRRNLQSTVNNLKNQKLNASPNHHNKSKMALNNNNNMSQQSAGFQNSTSWFNGASPAQPWISTSPPSGQYSMRQQQKWAPVGTNFFNNQTNNSYSNRNNYFNKPTVKV